MARYSQFLNQSTRLGSYVTNGITDAAVGGTTNDAVLRFTAGNETVTGTGIAGPGATAAVDGDAFTISLPGIYQATFVFSQAAATTVMLGISQDVAAAGLTTDPVMATAGMLVVATSVLPAANTIYTTLTATISVTHLQAQTGSIIRCHGTDGADAVIPDASILDNTECTFRLVRLGNLI